LGRTAQGHALPAPPEFTAQGAETGPQGDTILGGSQTPQDEGTPALTRLTNVRLETSKTRICGRQRACMVDFPGRVEKNRQGAGEKGAPVWIMSSVREGRPQESLQRTQNRQSLPRRRQGPLAAVGATGELVASGRGILWIRHKVVIRLSIFRLFSSMVLANCAMVVTFSAVSAVSGA